MNYELNRKKFTRTLEVTRFALVFSRAQTALKSRLVGIERAEKEGQVKDLQGLNEAGWIDFRGIDNYGTS